MSYHIISGRFLECTGIPYTVNLPGERPGEPGFRVRFGILRNKYNKVDWYDQDRALALLQKVRSEWDEHLSKINSPSARLQACLDMFVREHHLGTPPQLPLFFPGEGTLTEVIQFHTSMNPMCINGPPSNVPGYYAPSYPNNILGHWLGCYLRLVERDMYYLDYSTSTQQVKEVLWAVLDSGVYLDLEAFFTPFDSYPKGALYPFDGYRLFFDKGDMFIECMIERYNYMRKKEGVVLEELKEVILKMMKVNERQQGKGKDN